DERVRPADLREWTTDRLLRVVDHHDRPALPPAAGRGPRIFFIRTRIRADRVRRNDARACGDGRRLDARRNDQLSDVDQLRRATRSSATMTSSGNATPAAGLSGSRRRIDARSNGNV